jgi:REP element-mobilizing transposase RayT
MPRRPRVHVAGAFYHVTLRGNHRQAIFRHDADRSTLNAIVAEQIQKFEARLHAYCWMSNHLHLLVQVSDTPLGRPMQHISACYARWFQSTLPTTGHLFERRYHATLVDVESYLLEVVRYIHLNPVRAELVKDPSEYRWSSHGVYLGERREPWITTNFVLGMLSPTGAGAKSAYREFVLQGVNSTGSSSRSTQDGDDTVLVQSIRTDPLERLIASECHELGVQPAELAATGRDRRLARVRAVIVQKAVAQQLTSLAAMARRFNRDESSLRESVQRHGNPIEITPDFYTGTGRGQA